jgi:hypothetical protein
VQNLIVIADCFFAALQWTCGKSEPVFQCELDDPRIRRCRGNHSKGRPRSTVVDGQTELWRVREIEKLGTEFHGTGFGNSKISLNSQIDVALVGPTQYANAAIPKAGTVANYRRRSERGGIEVSVETARNGSGRGRVRTGALRPGEADEVSIDRSCRAINRGNGKA